MESAAAAGERKRKVYLGESELSASSIHLKAPRLDDVASANSASPASSGDLSCETVGGDDAFASCCTSNGSGDLTKETSKFVDLEDNEDTVEVLTTSAGDSLDCRERSETTPVREARGESGELESIREPDPRRHSAEMKMPSEAELEEFFAAAEKNIQQKFIDKYNYDIVKDQPLEGRYEWVLVPVRPE
ncbi:hypothetical protein SASPL_152037 [Salvia splendens]|uniref:Cyclin-dependent kinase inhibitor domain-containing protein n=1 Tax=Salvia splendens TaxID=180675 RepID=A0A8X8W2I1_SALSN|nr:cyclin-dependent kinase inhibitor 6-like [Salvia splendens]KAG6386860.1 hypothetical protein SASPL_152037 [Salvia splendens]